jgi:ketosteroid isomerase-like protein/quercetin dioxygenase-like cupin family protein
MRRWIVVPLMAGFLVGCGSTANVEKERETLMRLDREWSASVKDIDKFMSYYAPDASVYAPGMPLAKGPAAIREALTKMLSAPGFSLEFGPTKADVAASGDVGYTTGTYQATMGGTPEKGKYVEVWKKQPDGQWKVREDIFNPDSSGVAPTSHVMVQPASIAWSDPPPSLPRGSKIAVIAGDPSKPGPFVIRGQVPAGYKIAPHWHPGDENLTVLSGTVALGMGDAWDESKMQTLGIGGYAALPAEMRHSFLAKTASTIQVHGIGPFVVNYVNPADDPSKK